MKLLLDEHFSQVIAQQLRQKGFDVVAVIERPELVGASDGEIFAAAIEEQRALVTNNVRDFMPLAEQHAAMGSRHFGLVLTSDRSLPRSKKGIGAMVRSLAQLIADRAPADALADQTVWPSAKR